MASPKIQYSTPMLSRESIDYRPAAASGIAVAVAWALLCGTGGAATPHYIQNRGQRGYQFTQIHYVEDANVELHSPVANLEQILKVFKPSISGLASVFGVSRQTIYNWISGERPSVDSANRLEDLAKAADIAAVYGLDTSVYLLKRKIQGGKNLMEIVKNGGSAQEAVQSLIRIAKQETQQRDLLNKRLAGRRIARQEDSEFGIPMLDEDVG